MTEPQAARKIDVGAVARAAAALVVVIAIAATAVAVGQPDNGGGGAWAQYAAFLAVSPLLAKMLTS